MGRIRRRLTESARTFAALGRSRALRRLELAHLGSELGLWAYSIALSLYAFDIGGIELVGVVTLLRLLPAAVAAPFLGVLGDRYPPVRVMVATDLARAALLGGIAAAVAIGAAPAIVFILAGANTILSTAFGPARAALLPRLARDPEELTAVNVVAGTIEAAAMFGGPALGGLLLVATNYEVVFVATVAALLWSAVLVAAIDVPASGATAESEEAEAPSFLRDAAGGLRAIRDDSALRLLLTVFSTQTFVAGALGVLTIPLALEELDMGRAGPGLLDSAMGVGAIAGGVVAAVVVGSRLALTFAVGVVFWGLPIVLAGLVLQPAVALAAMAVIGVANTVGDASVFSLLQRIAPEDVVARVFGVLESLWIGTCAIGGLAAAALVQAVGVDVAMVIFGALPAGLVLLRLRPLLAIDARVTEPVERLELLRSIPIFAPLDPATLEGLARRLEPVRASAGARLVEQDHEADRFVLIADGEVEVTIDETFIRRQGPGTYFGEIALLRRVPRTATVTAVGDVSVYALNGDDFVTALSGHPASVDAAEALIAQRFGPPRLGLAPL